MADTDANDSHPWEGRYFFLRNIGEMIRHTVIAVTTKVEIVDSVLCTLSSNGGCSSVMT